MTAPIIIHELDRDRLYEILSYDAETGAFTWKMQLSPKGKVGSPAGHVHWDGYRYIGIDKKQYLAHQLAWLYVHGDAPEQELDFINGNRSDLRLANLRLATRVQNNWNSRRKPNKTGYLGVTKYFHRYHAKIRVDGKRITIGTFDTAEEAHEAYKKRAKELHGEFAKTDGACR